MFPTLPRTDTESPSLEFWRISAITVDLLILEAILSWRGLRNVCHIIDNELGLVCCASEPSYLYGSSSS